MFKKNDLITCEITDIGMEGEGIGKCDGFTFFIKDTVIGDLVEAKIINLKKSYGYARLERLIRESDDRVAAACSVARQCGGCALQQMSYQATLKFKEKKVLDCITRIGGFEVGDFQSLPIIGMQNPSHYRNKSQYPIGLNKDGQVVTGFYAQRSHNIIPVDDCLIGAQTDKYILDAIKAYINDFKESVYDEKTLKGTFRHVLIRTGFRTNEIMVCLVINAKGLKDEGSFVNYIESALEGRSSKTTILLNFNKANTNVILGDSFRILSGDGFIYDYIEDVKFKISAQSFFQVNPVQTDILYSKAIEFADINSDMHVWDMYCGIGTISLLMAKKAKKVYGVEIVDRAIKDAKENASLNAINNADFFVGKAEELVPLKFEEDKGQTGISKPDVVVVDPPRKGCDEKLLDTLAFMNPKRIVYVSCNPSTLARDLRTLADQGYKLEKVQPVEMFPYSCHVECVALLQRMSNTRQATITLDVDMEDYHRIKGDT